MSRDMWQLSFPGPRLIGMEVSYRTPPNSVVAKVPVFGVLYETFRPKSAKSRGERSLLDQIWLRATYRWRKTAKFSGKSPNFGESVPYLSSPEAQNSVVRVRDI